jgi:hypothetical protein
MSRKRRTRRARPGLRRTRRLWRGHWCERRRTYKASSGGAGHESRADASRATGIHGFFWREPGKFGGDGFHAGECRGNRGIAGGRCVKIRFLGPVQSAKCGTCDIKWNFVEMLRSFVGAPMVRQRFVLTRRS